MKKLLSLLLTLALLLGIGAPVYAADGGSDGSSSEAGLREEAIVKTLEALDEPLYKDTYTALLNGESIRNGSYGEVARGVQQTLVDFGQSIGVDGSIGSLTISALNAVQEAFGLEQTDALDATGYGELLECLRLYRDPEAWLTMLDETDSRPLYLAGCARVLRGEYFQAQECFRMTDYADAEKRADDCKQPWPSTGVIWQDPHLSSKMNLCFDINQSEDTGTFIKIFEGGTELVATLFVGGTGSASLWLPDGTYTIKYASGSDWYGSGDAFGPMGSYQIMTFDGGSSLVSLDAGYMYTITVDAEDSSPDAESVGSLDTSYEDF